MNNLPGTSFHVLVANQSETDTVIRKHMHITVADADTYEIVHFLQDENYPDTEVLLIAGDYASPEVQLPPVSTTETTPLH